MITTDSGITSLECDQCGAEPKEIFDDFYEAVAWKKDRDNGWRSKKIKEEWEDHCPPCIIYLDNKEEE